MYVGIDISDIIRIMSIIKKMYELYCVQLTVGFIVLLVVVVSVQYSMWNAVFPWVLLVLASFTISNIFAQQRIQETRKQEELKRQQELKMQEQELIREFERHEKELLREFERNEEELLRKLDREEEKIRSEYSRRFVEAKREMEIRFQRANRRKELEDKLEALKRKLEDLKENLYAFIDDTKKTEDELDSLAKALDEHFERIKGAKIGGATISIVGGIVSIVGLALIVPSFGASLIVTAVGCSISAAGGGIVGGSTAVDACLSLKQRKAAEERLNEYSKRKVAVLKSCREVCDMLKDNGNIDIKFPEWVSFWAKLVIGGMCVTKNITWDLIIKNILTAIRISSLADDVARIGVQAVGTGVKALGIAGGVIGILLIPLDIFTLVDSAIKVHKKTQHQSSQKIRNIAIQLKEDCPTSEEVDKMIQTVINNYRNQMDQDRQIDFLQNTGYLTFRP